MFNFKRTPQDAALDEAISDLIEELKNMEGAHPDYSDTADQLIKLMKLKTEVTHSWRPSPDALVGAAGSLLGILCILHFEKAGVITSKALSFVGKMK